MSSSTPQSSLSEGIMDDGADESTSNSCHNGVYRSHYQVSCPSVCLQIQCSSEFRERGKLLFYKTLAEFADLHPIWVKTELGSSGDSRAFEVSIKDWDVSVSANEEGVIDEAEIFSKVREICKCLTVTFSLV